MSIAAPKVEILIGGTHVDPNHFRSWIVERDMYQPDMASVVLANEHDIYSTKKIGDPVELKVGVGGGDSIYQGEIVGLEPTYKGGQIRQILIRALNKMHRLLRKRKSITWTEKSDEQILKAVCGDAGLSLEWKHEKSITYDHVYQHNQTDLEFLRMRAARMGCHVWCVGTKVYVKQPDLSLKTGIKLAVDKSQDVALVSFTPRLSSAGIVKKVTVKGWNPEKKELIEGSASVSGSKLGSQTSVAGSGELGNEETFTVDHPIWSKEEADALAKGRLVDLSLTYIVGEAEIAPGYAKFEIGKSVEIQANGKGADDPFNGDYYIMGLTHRYTAPKGKDGGYVTILKLARDAQKK